MRGENKSWNQVVTYVFEFLVWHKENDFEYTFLKIFPNDQDYLINTRYIWMIEHLNFFT